jgi:dihydrofolate reductase
VHGSIGLVSALLSKGLLDELRLIVCPVLAGSGRRLLPDGCDAAQLDLLSARSTPSGLQYLVYRPQ